MQIGIDKSAGEDLTVYTIPHKLAFEFLERQVCRQFHDSGNFSTFTRADVRGDEITFVVQVRKNSESKEGE